MSTTQVIDIQDWTKTELIPKRRLDVAVAELVYGIQIIGWARDDAEGALIHNPNESWLKDNKETMCTDPVFVRKCECDRLDALYAEDDFSKEKFFGHYSNCMAAVPCYSRNIYDALSLITALQDSTYFTLTNAAADRSWRVQLQGRDRTNPTTFSDPSLATAITQAVFEYVQALGKAWKHLPILGVE